MISLAVAGDPAAWIPDLNSVLLLLIGAIIAYGAHNVRRLTHEVAALKKDVDQLMAWLFGVKGKGEGFADRVISLEHEVKQRGR